MNEFLETAQNDYTLKFQKEKIDFLKSSSSNTPVLNAVELRTRTNRYDINRQRYTVRLRPNGWGESKIAKKVYETTKRFNESQHWLLLNNALKNRYLMVIDLLFNRACLELEQSLIVLYEDKIKALKKMSDNLDFDAKDLIDAEDQVVERRLDQISLENKIKNIEDEIRIIIPGQGTIEFDKDKITDHKLIMSNVEKIPPEPGKDNIYLKTAEIAAELALEDFNLEKAEKRRYIDFLEANYDMEEQNELNRALSLEIGISLPIVNPNRLEINRGMLDSLDEKLRYEEEKRNVAKQIIINSQELKGLLDQYAVLYGKRRSGMAGSSLEAYLGIEGFDPLALLEFKESILKTDIALEKINYQIYIKYIELLDISGKLIEKPIINYLSENNEEIIR
jgi:hypothetical protein